MMIVMMMVLTSQVTRGPPLSPWQESLPSPPAQIIWSVIVPGLYRVAVVQPALDLKIVIFIINNDCSNTKIHYLVVTSASCSTLGCEPPNVVVPHPVTVAFTSS